MGNPFDFRTYNRKRKRGALRNYGPVVFGGLAIGAVLAVGLIQYQASGTAPTEFSCAKPRVVDGDTIRCGRDRIRLAHIDAPELPGHCNPGRTCTPGDPLASRDNLARLMAGADIRCRSVDVDRYGRTVALCRANDRDLSCAQYESGFAVERYGRLSC